MRVCKKVETTIHEHHREVGRICDLCGGPTKPQSSGLYNETEIVIDARIGNVWPEGDCREAFAADLCVDCFKDKVLPLLVALGVKVRRFVSDDGDREFVLEGEKKPA